MRYDPFLICFLFIAIVGGIMGSVGSYAASLGPCMGDAECMAEEMAADETDRPFALAQR